MIPQTRLVLLSLCLLGIFLRSIHLNDVVKRTPDEYTYAAFGQGIAEHGPGYLPELVTRYNADPKAWIFPPPMRAGYVLLLGISMKLAGGVYLSYIASCLGLLMVALAGYRLLAPIAAIYATFAMATSVPDQLIARRCWPDALIGLLGIVMIWGAAELLRDPKWWNIVTFTAAGTFSVCVKEFGAVVYGLCILYVLVALIHKKDWEPVIALLNWSWVLGVVGLTFLIISAGGTHPLLTGWQHMTGAVNTNGYAWEYQNLPWYLLFKGFLILMPVTSILAVCGMFDRQMRVFAWMVISLIAAILIIPTLENFRYLSPVYGAICLLAGAGTGRIWDKVGNMGRIVLIIVLLGDALLQSQKLEAYVIRDVQDLSLRLVLEN